MGTTAQAFSHYGSSSHYHCQIRDLSAAETNDLEPFPQEINEPLSSKLFALISFHPRGRSKLFPTVINLYSYMGLSSLPAIPFPKLLSNSPQNAYYQHGILHYPASDQRTVWQQMKSIMKQWIHGLTTYSITQGSQSNRIMKWPVTLRRLSSGITSCRVGRLFSRM